MQLLIWKAYSVIISGNHQVMVFDSANVAYCFLKLPFVEHLVQHITSLRSTITLWVLVWLSHFTDGGMEAQKSYIPHSQSHNQPVAESHWTQIEEQIGPFKENIIQPLCGGSHVAIRQNDGLNQKVKHLSRESFWSPLFHGTQWSQQ